MQVVAENKITMAMQPSPFCVRQDRGRGKIFPLFNGLRMFRRIFFFLLPAAPVDHQITCGKLFGVFLEFSDDFPNLNLIQYR